MLTWKIFVIVMSVTSLTIVNVNSADDPSSSNTPGSFPTQFVTNNPEEIPFYTLSDDSNSNNPFPRESAPISFTTQIIIYNPDNKHSYIIDSHSYNPFFQGTVSYKCFRQITLFCDIENFEIRSQNCIKKAILNYKNNLMAHLDGNLMDLKDAHNFYNNFPINAEAIPLPSTYCHNQGVLLAELCKIDLRDYEVLLQNLQDTNQSGSTLTENQLQHVIAKFALLERTILGINEESFETQYLIAISDKITSENEGHNPLTFCQNLQDQQNIQSRNLFR